MKTSEQIDDLAAALAKAQGTIEGAVKGAVNPAFRSRYADLGSVWEAIRAPLSAAGIAVVQGVSAGDGRVTCTTRLLKGAQWIESELSLPVSKPDAQGYGSAATYARRYSLMGMVGIAPIDDDGNAAVGHGSAAHAPAGNSAPARPRPSQPTAEAVDPEMLAAGEAAARLGTTAITDWWRTLTSQDRARLNPHVAELRRVARAADEEAAHA